jgi:hypothetical protein
MSAQEKERRFIRPGKSEKPKPKQTSLINRRSFRLLILLDESAPMLATVVTDWIGAVCQIVMAITGIMMLPAASAYIRRIFNASPHSPSATQAIDPEKQTKAEAPPKNKILRLFFDREAAPFTFFFLVSVGWVVALTADSSPATRLSVLGISAFTALAFVCICYLSVRVVQYVIAVRILRK